MYNLIVDLWKTAKENLIPDLRTPVRVQFVKALLKPFYVMYAEFVALRTEAAYKASYSGRVIDLETVLNDRFDNLLRRIYIADSNYDNVYIYRKSELLPALIMYRKWKSTTNFATGKFCFYQGAIYEANAPALNKIPGVDPEWTLRPARKAPVLRKKVNYNGSISFYVMVPVSLIFNTDEMKSLINYYKLAGFGYQIKTF